MPVTITPTVTPLYVGATTGLRFDFNTTDTITKNDYFTIKFPANSLITYVFKTTNLQLATNANYYNANNSL
jgi:hypothetical protein